MNLNITLDEARALHALARAPSLGAAARSLRKSPSALVYTLEQLETKVGFSLVDRSQYRTRLHPSGTRVLEACKKLLTAEQELEAICTQIAKGVEPELTIVMDGVVPHRSLLRAMSHLSQKKVPTQVRLIAEYLSSVESTFQARNAQMMISVLPPQSPHLKAYPLPVIPLRLVISKPTRKLSGAELQALPLLTVQGSDTGLRLPTDRITSDSKIQLPDFHAKRQALIEGLGYGWMPLDLIQEDLAKRRLSLLSWAGKSTYELKPHLYTLPEPYLGKTARWMVQQLTRD